MNIIIIIITITFIFYWIDYFCKYETYSNEGVQNLNKVYNKKKLIINNLNIKNNLNVNGELECYGNGTFENAKIGNWESDNKYAMFSHKNRTSDNYGVLQSDINTIINSATDSKVYIRNNNNNNKMSVSGNSIRFDKDELGIELKWISLSGHGSADTGYAIKDYVCTLADYRGDGDDGEFIKYKYFINKTTNDNWWVSVCKSYDSKTGKLDGCPSSDKGWRYVTVLAIPRILFSKINNQYYDDSK